MFYYEAMKSSKTTIVLSDEAKRLVREDSELFGGNISAYVTYLILDAHKHKKCTKITSEGDGNIQVVGDNNKTKAKTKIKK